MILTDGVNTLTFDGEWVGQLLTPQNTDITIAGNIRRQAAESRMGFIFAPVRLEASECAMLRTIFDNTTVQYLTLTVDRDPFTKTTKSYYVVFTSPLKLKQEAGAGGGDIAYYIEWKMEEVLYV